MPQQISKEILQNGIKDTDLDTLKQWGDFLAKKDFKKERDRNGRDRDITITPLSTSQIRKFFGEIKRIQADFENSKNEIILLDPKIAYAVGRAKKDGVSKIEDFYAQVSPLLREIHEDKARFKNFVNIVEAIIAYHKAAEGN